MEEKRIKRKAIARAIKEILIEQRISERKKVADLVEKEMEFDERILILRQFMGIVVGTEEIGNDMIERLILREQSSRTKSLPNTWMDNSEFVNIVAKLEMMTDEELRKYSLEELASLVKDN